MDADAPVYVAVVGAGEAGTDLLADAEAVGRALARAGAILVCGGRGGVMEAASRGAVEEGGIAIGLLPDGDRAHANPFLTVSVPTGLGELDRRLRLGRAHSAGRRRAAGHDEVATGEVHGRFPHWRSLAPRLVTTSRKLAISVLRTSTSAGKRPPAEA